LGCSSATTGDRQPRRSWPRNGWRRSWLGGRGGREAGARRPAKQAVGDALVEGTLQAGQALFERGETVIGRNDDERVARGKVSSRSAPGQSRTDVAGPPSARTSTLDISARSRCTRLAARRPGTRVAAGGICWRRFVPMAYGGANRIQLYRRLPRRRDGSHGGPLPVQTRARKSLGVCWERQCPPEAFMVLELQRGAFGSGGVVRDHPAFG
jgi:hypothetical protein